MSWRPHPRTVYFAEACGKVKIGCSNDVRGRLAVVGEWIPFPLNLLAEMPGGYDVEASIHRMFDAEWSHGEWFNLSPQLQAFIASVSAGNPPPIDTSACSVRRRGFIADKKRITHKITRCRKAGHKFPAELLEAIRSVPKGTPIPPDLLGKANAFIDERLAA